MAGMVAPGDQVSAVEFLERPEVLAEEEEEMVMVSAMLLEVQARMEKSSFSLLTSQKFINSKKTPHHAEFLLLAAISFGPVFPLF